MGLLGALRQCRGCVIRQKEDVRIAASARTHSRERKVRRPRWSVPPETLRPTTSRGRRTSSLLLVPRGVPPCESPFPSIGLSLGRPPQNDLHREDAVTDSCVLCTSLVATWDRSGCSRVARSAPPAMRGDRGRSPAGRRPPELGCGPAPVSAGQSGMCRVPDDGARLDRLEQVDRPIGEPGAGGADGAWPGRGRGCDWRPATPRRTRHLPHRAQAAKVRRDQGNGTCPAP
jgi:hypothetical protein